MHGRGVRRIWPRGRAGRFCAAAGIVLAAGVLLLRAVPRLVPWAGEETLNGMVWSPLVLDRDGRLLQVRPVNSKGLRRIYVSGEAIPRELKRIVRVSEDRRFFFHPGFDLFSLARAGRNYLNGNIRGGGGSTITMQLARIIHPRPEGLRINVGVKLREIWEALQIESRYSKKEILEFYINLVPFGRNVEGFAAAARLYYGRPLEKLTAEEFCVLTVIPRSPSRFDPFVHRESVLKAAGELAAAALQKSGGGQRRGRAESRRAESRRAESGRAESAPVESAQPESALPDSGRAESGPPESHRAESGPPTDSRRPNGPVDSGPAERAQPESRRAESGRHESALPDIRRAESGQPENHRAESGPPTDSRRADNGPPDAQPAAPPPFSRRKELQSFQAGETLLHEPFPWPFYAPHFVRRLSEELTAYAENPPESISAESVLEMLQGKKPVRTSLDLTMQEHCRGILQEEVSQAGSFRIGNGALLLASPETMEVLVYLGSADFLNEENSGQIDGVRMLREPGSTLKPLLYANALDAGWTASTILPDIPVEFGAAYGYTPENYNQQYHGPVRLRQALSASLNIPAVYTLERLSVAAFTDTLIRAGFESLEDQREHLGLSMAVGGVNVSLAELVQAYGGLYSGGVVRRLSFLKENSAAGEQIWTAEAAELVTDIISRSDDRVMSFGRSGPVHFDYPAAIKTGTSNQFNNIWAIGFTSDLIGGVWMGNFDGSTVIAAPGSSLPARVLHLVFDTWSARGELPQKSEFIEEKICSLSGMRAGARCPYTMKEYFRPGLVPDVCSWHVRGAPASGRPRYPQEYMHWAKLYGYNVDFSGEAALAIVSPAEGAVYYSGHVRAGMTGSGEAELLLNGRRVFQGSLPADSLLLLDKGRYTLVLRQRGQEAVRRFEVR